MFYTQRAFAILATALALSGCASATGEQRQTPSSPPSETAAARIDPQQRIAFGRWSATGDRNVPPVMWTANADGSDPQPVGEQRGWYIEWSPDRTHMLFDFADDDGNEHIGRVNPDGSDFRQLTEGAGFFADPAYSPDGETIVFSFSPVPESDPAWRMQLAVMGADGSDPRPLLSPDLAGVDWEPVFSPDGSQIVFTRDMEQESGVVSAIHVVNADGTEVRQLTPFDDYVEHPRWSPDGTTVIYNIEAQRGGLDEDRNGIWTVPASGGDPTHLLPTNEELHAFKPTYSPDGTRILFGCAHRTGLNEDLCVMKADGREVEIVVETPEYENFGVWY